MSTCGYIALVGRPNVGKSTLLNFLLDKKLSITSKKPQTTRHSILGIRTVGEDQYVFVDTPGIHQGSKKMMNRMMNKTAINTLHDVDVVAFIVDGTRWTDEDAYVLELIKKAKMPCVLVINKMDKIADRAVLLPAIASMEKQYDFAAIVPISAKTGYQVDQLMTVFRGFLPEGPHLFYDDQSTDRSQPFLCAELLREKIFRLCGEELPYSITVDIESFKEEEKLYRIHALILVEKESHKRMIIGKYGQKLKEIASSARIDMEALLGKKVFLRAFCKVKPGWSDDKRLLTQLGYDH